MGDLQINRAKGFVSKKIAMASALVAASIGAALLAGCMSPDASLGTASGSPGEVAVAFSVAEGTYSLVVSNSGKCMDVAGGSTLSGANVDQWKCSGGSNQAWKVRATSSGTYNLVSVRSGKCADVYNNGKTDGVNVEQWGCNGGANQQWKFVSMGSGFYEVVSVNSGKCLDVNGASTADGANIAQWTCHGGSNQKFKLAGSSSTPTPTPTPPPTTGWRKSNLTNFESYPAPGSAECIQYNGCTWAGQFAALSGKQTLDWVKSHNIISVHERDFSKYKLKTFRITQGSHQIDAVVYDECADSDCNGCCTANANANGVGFLIDMEKYTVQRFGVGEGIVSWTCLNCN